MAPTTFGRYHVLEQIGQGGMGVVYRAHDTLLERIVALKVIASSIDGNPELRDRFFREARAAGQLTHPNIITIYDLGEHEGQPYLAMEFLTGEDLQRRLARPEPMRLARKLEIAADVCEGLSYAHRRGVVHRDIKPANIFITDEGVVKVLDFGLARMVASELTGSNMMMGTLNYMAPEQVRGERTDHRADIFSLGVVIYELLSGRKAFQGDSFATTIYKILQEVPEPLHAIDGTLPPDLVQLVEKAIAKTRDERYHDLSDLARDLALVRQHLSNPGTERFVTVSSPGSGLASTPGSGPQSAPPPDGAAISGAPPSGSLTLRARHGWIGIVAAGGVVLAAAASAWLMLREPASPAGGGRAASNVTAAAAAASGPATPQVAPPPAQPSSPPSSPPPAAADAGGEARPGRGTAPADSRAADAARQRMSRAREAADRAGPAARRFPAYAAATDAEREAGRLYRSGSLTEAAAKFSEAAGLFQSAQLAASIKPEPAPSSSQGPGSSPAPPPPSTPPSRSDAAPPSTPDASARQDEPAATPQAGPVTPPAEPAGGPAAAAASKPQQPAPAPLEPLKRNPLAAGPARGPQPEPAPSADAGVRAALRRYEQALESRSLDALQQIWPSLQGAQESAIRKEFSYARTIDVEIDSPQITVTGTSATARFIRRYAISTNDGQRLLTRTLTTMTLRRAGGDWVIDSVRYEAIR